MPLNGVCGRRVDHDVGFPMNEFVSAFLPGLNTMANVHPLVVHFPIALLSSFLLAEVLALLLRADSLRSAASWMLYFGTGAALAAVLAGFQAASTVDHSEEVHALLERHETYGLTVLALAVVLSAARWLFRNWTSGIVRGMQIALGSVLVGVMTLGADLGGLMVYGHGVAVRTSCEQDSALPAMEEALPLPLSSRPQTARGQGAMEVPPHGHHHSHAHSHHHHHR